jgi:hypothetical protein
VVSGREKVTSNYWLVNERLIVEGVLIPEGTPPKRFMHFVQRTSACSSNHRRYKTVCGPAPYLSRHALASGMRVVQCGPRFSDFWEAYIGCLWMVLPAILTYMSVGGLACDRRASRDAQLRVRRRFKSDQPILIRSQVFFLIEHLTLCGVSWKDLSFQSSYTYLSKTRP